MNQYRFTTRAAMYVTLAVAAGLSAAPAAIASERVCQLITDAEASAAVGATVSPGMLSKDESGDSLCRHVAARQGMLAVTLGEDHAQEKYAKAKAKLERDPALTPENISGLGDQAVFWNTSRGISGLLVVKGDKCVGIALAGRTVNISKETL